MDIESKQRRMKRIRHEHDYTQLRKVVKSLQIENKDLMQQVELAMEPPYGYRILVHIFHEVIPDFNSPWVIINKENFSPIATWIEANRYTWEINVRKDLTTIIKVRPI